MSKSNPATLGPSISDFLKWESTPLTRTTVPAAIGTKAGAFVLYPLRDVALIALTDESDGKVVIQPHNCIMDLSLISEDAIETAYQTTEDETATVQTMSKLLDPYGIVFVGTPISSTETGPVGL